MTPAVILAAAATLTPEQAGKLAHALGWPARNGARYRKGRNYYCAPADDTDWPALAALGLAVGAKETAGSADRYWSATPLGALAVRVYIEAVAAAHPADWRHVFAMRAEGMAP